VGEEKREGLWEMKEEKRDDDGCEECVPGGKCPWVEMIKEISHGSAGDGGW